MSMTPNEAAMRTVSTPADLNISEAFHRLKRTVLLFSAVLFVVSIADPKEVGSLHMTILDLDISMAVARLLLFGAATYYLIGFLLEARVCIRLNANIFSRSPGRKFELAIEAVACELEIHAKTFSDEVPKIVSAYNGQVQRLEDAIERLSVDPSLESYLGGEREGNYMLRRQLSPEEIEAREASIKDGVRTNLINQGYESAGELQSTLKSQNAALAALSEEAKSAAQVARKAHKDLTTLNQLTSAERRLSFWVWEIGGAMVAYVVATLSLFPWSAWLSWIQPILATAPN